MATETPQLLPLPSKTIHQFPIPTWVENLALRHNGQILLTLMTSPDLYLLDPSIPDSAILIHTFSPSLSLLGIVEIKKDFFYLVAGNYNTTTTWKSESGSYSIWEVDLTSYVPTTSSAPPKIRKVTALAEAGLLNGLEKHGEFLLAADSENGCVWKVDPVSNTYEIFMQVEEMKPPPPPVPQVGINGIKIRDGYLYWSNTMLQLFCRVKLDDKETNRGKKQEVEIMERECVIDDFCFDKEGRAWFAQNTGNTVAVRVESGGGWKVVVVGEGREVAGATACAFERAREDGDSGKKLYVVTTGGMANPFDGKVEGGRVVVVDTSGVEERSAGISGV